MKPMKRRIGNSLTKSTYSAETSTTSAVIKLMDGVLSSIPRSHGTVRSGTGVRIVAIREKTFNMARRAMLKSERDRAVESLEQVQSKKALSPPKRRT